METMTSGRSASYSAISTYSRVRILHQLQTTPQRTITDLVGATGLHANTVREHLQRLVEEGYVVGEPEQRKVRGRPRVLYSASDGVTASSPVRQRKVKESAARGDLLRRVLPGSVGGEGLSAVEQHQMDAVVDELLDSGFDPVIDEDGLTIDLTPCAHAQAQAEHRDVLCQVHLSLLQGVLTEARGPLAVDGMRQSCDPRECVIHLTRTPPAGESAD
jgi:predicted ArsR family transcriptional regulator